MKLELKVPEVGESITEVEIGDWLRKKGEQVRKDEPVVTLESEKATVELPAPDSGTLSEVLKKKGETAKVGEVVGFLETNGQTAAPRKEAEGKAATKATQTKPQPSAEKQDVAVPSPAPSEPEKKTKAAKPAEPAAAVEEAKSPDDEPPTPVQPKQRSGAAPSGFGPLPANLSEELSDEATAGDRAGLRERQEETVPMSRLRRTVAERLVAAQHQAALLTTFNEVDMSNVIALRKEYGESFQQKYNVKLGFMGFFVRASIEALKQFPGVNAEIQGTNIVYHNYYDIGIAVGSGKGLVVPVVRNAERMSFAEIETAIGDFGRRAKENKLKVEELQGGTFTISNGGVFGSLLSTPIINPPQSGVLGLHAIQERPVAREGNVVIRPMMYVALTYDHRLVDGREAVSWLKRVKEVVENPARMLLEI
jgi:2-oxoglutarate dehydrogenase E2 component (dihydrolipoamide succinyltransferase)